MALPLIQQALSAGEIAPELYGQVALGKYASAATTLRNMIVNYRGGGFSRAGLAFVGVCLQSTFLRQATSTGSPRPIPFQFSNNQGYTLEFGDNYVRFVFMGGYVLETGITITGVTRANPAVVSVAGQPFNNGDWVFFSGVGGMTQLNGNTYVVASTASGHFALQDLNGNNINSSAFTAFTSGGTVARIYTLNSPYAAIDLPYLKFSQTADVMSLTCSNPLTATEYPPYELKRLAGNFWTLAPVQFNAVIAPPPSCNAASNASAPTSGVNATFNYVATAVDRLGNESIPSPIASCHGADLQVEAGTNTVTCGFVSGAKFYNFYRAPASVDGSGGPIDVALGSLFGFVGSSFGTTFTDNNTTPDLSQTPPVHKNPFAVGQILSVPVQAQGSSLGSSNYAITTLGGLNFVGNPAVVGGVLGGVPIIDNGYSYLPGDSIALDGNGFASGAIQFGTTNPSPGDTITLNGVTWAFVAATTGANQTLIQGALSATLAQLVGDLAASTNGSLTVATYAVDILAQNLLVTAVTAGAGGNSYTLAASAATPTGATLTGGVGSGTSPVAATGTITFSANPANGNVFTINGEVWHFENVASGTFRTQIQSTLALTLAQLSTDLNSSGIGPIAVATYSVTATVLTITYKTPGPSGNTYTMKANTSPVTLSGATLTGGSNSGPDAAASLTIGPQSGTFPGVVTYFQDRRFFASSFNNPDTFYASQTGNYANFDIHIPSQATDAVTATPWSIQVNGIQWMVPMPGGLIMMTGLQAWQVLGEGSYQLNAQPITPSTTQAQPQAFNGCSATIPPIVIDDDVLYVQAIGNTTVFDLSWNFWVNIYTGNDLTILSSHLFTERSIVQWGWARQPFKVVWCSCDDGTFLTFTFLKDQQVYGWARGDTQGLAVGLCVITEPPTNAVYAITQRFPPYAPQGIFVMERFDDRNWNTVDDTFALDSAVSNAVLTSGSVAIGASAPSGAGVVFSASAGIFPTNAVGQVIRMCGGIATITARTSITSVTGTWNLAATNGPAGFPYAPAGTWSLAPNVSTLNAPHLAGMTVSALCDGVPVSGIVVGATGAIALPFSCSAVVAGLPFTVQVQTPYLNGDGVAQGARKVIPAVTVRVAASGTGFQTGTNQPDGAAQDPPVLAPAWTNLATADTTKPTGGQTSGAPTYTNPTGGHTVTQLWTGDYRIVGGGASWESKGQVAIQQTLPLPLEVIAIMPEYLPGDIPEVTYKPAQAPSGAGPRGQQPQQSPSGPGPGAYMLRHEG